MSEAYRRNNSRQLTGALMLSDRCDTEHVSLSNRPTQKRQNHIGLCRVEQVDQADPLTLSHLGAVPGDWFRAHWTLCLA